MPKKTAKKSARRAPASPRQESSSDGVSASAPRHPQPRDQEAGNQQPRARSSKQPARSSAGSRSAARTSDGTRQSPGTRQSGRSRRRSGVAPLEKLYGPVTAQLVVSPCGEAMEFYERAFGAREVLRKPGPDGLPVHAEIDVGGALITLSDQLEPGAFREAPRRAGGVMLYVQDVDAAFRRAVEAGATATMPPQDQFWGDRFSQVEDPYGHLWSIATHIRDVSLEEMQAALARMHTAEA